MNTIRLEFCVDTIDGLIAAIDGGADRIELCSALALGGLTPTAGLIRAAASLPVPVYAMIRPRAGGFVFSEAEIGMMEAEIEAVGAAGLAGVVLGASLADRRLDAATLARLSSKAGALGRTLHRAFDLTPAKEEALATAIDLGFERILTSGGALTAADGIAVIGDLVNAARERISIMPGAGVTLANAATFVAAGVTEIHASCSQAVPTGDAAFVDFGFAPSATRRTDRETVRALKSVLDQA